MRYRNYACTAIFATLVGCSSTGFETTDYDYNYDSPAATPAQATAMEDPAPLADPAQQPAAAATVVRLKAGDTLYSLSVQHFGTGRRWQDIAALNGFSDAQVRNLAVGQTIKLPGQ